MHDLRGHSLPIAGRYTPLVATVTAAAIGTLLVAAAPRRALGQVQSPTLTVPERPGSSRPRRLPKARMLPLPEAQWTEVHRALVAKYSEEGRVGNALRTLLHVPELVDGTMPFHTYLERDSSLSARHREILILRTAWLLNNDYAWAEHAPIAMRSGVTSAELRRIAEGPQARAWDPFEATLLQLADELFRNSGVADATWAALSARYDLFHLIDAVMTVTHFIDVLLVYNSLGIQPDARLSDRIPTDIPYRVSVPPRGPALEVARVEPAPGPGLAIARTFARYPKLNEPRAAAFAYVSQRSNLDPRYRELLILRTGWNCQSEYEWSQHVGTVGRARERGLEPLKIAEGPTASGWEPFDAALLNAADELYRDSLVSDRTWSAVAARFDTKTLFNALITTTNYRMVSTALNALGVQIDPGEERLPARSGR